jgi:hypothetical protein
MHLGSEIEGKKDLDEFTEHLLQARLANFWKSAQVNCNYGHDIVAAEEQYEKFCNEYLATLPSAFALQPNTQWDTQLPALAKQRELLHISIFESLCYNFRSTLLLNPHQTRNLPRYKQVLLLYQRRALAVAALDVLKCALSLHTLMGGSQTRFPDIIRPMFEAAVLLVYVSMDRSLFEGAENRRHTSSRLDPLEVGMARLKQEECMKAIRGALTRLQMLAEVSQMAKISAQALLRLLQRTINRSGPVQPEARPFHQANEAVLWPNDDPRDAGLPEYSDSHRVFLPGTAMATDLDYLDMNWEELASGL